MKTKFSEYDVVRLIRSCDEKVPIGTSGTVLMVFPSFTTQYEVEFFDDEEISLAVLTVNEDDLQLVQHI
jgi:hypothetical protein